MCTLPHLTFPETQQFVVDISPDIWFRNTTNVLILHFGVWCCTYTMTFVHLVLYIYDILGLHTTNVLHSTLRCVVSYITMTPCHLMYVLSTMLRIYTSVFGLHETQITSVILCRIYDTYGSHRGLKPRVLQFHAWPLRTRVPRISTIIYAIA